ncbi:hypothetical protein D3C78_1342600 [compost metagenome]
MQNAIPVIQNDDARILIGIMLKQLLQTAGWNVRERETVFLHSGCRQLLHQAYTVAAGCASRRLLAIKPSCWIERPGGGLGHFHQFCQRIMKGVLVECV